MKSFLGKILLFAVIVVIAYGSFFSIKIVPAGRIILVKDLRSGHSVRVLSRPYSFAPEGAMPWLYTLREMPLSRSLVREVSLPIPGIAELKDARYDIGLSINLDYLIDMNDPASIELLMKEEGVDETLAAMVQSALSRELENLMAPAYRRDQIYSGRDRIEKVAAEKIAVLLKHKGLSLRSFLITGMRLPEMAVYFEGVRHLDDLNRIKRKSELDERFLAKKLQQDTMANEEYYKRLERISVLIKSNPELLKYIYIDKLSQKIQVVHSIENLDLLGVFDKGAKGAPPSSGEINNLR